MDAFHGRWELRNGVRVPVSGDAPKPNKGGRPPKPILGSWTPERIRQAHTRHNAGDRSLLVVEGERLYQRGRKRAQRGRMTAADRAWCERNAVAWSWTFLERGARMTNAT